MVKADAGELEQVLVNLAVNSRDAMPGGGKLTIDTGNVTVDDAYAANRPDLKPGRYVRVRVSDRHGRGPRGSCPRFEPSHTTKPKGQGTGLGLATVYSIITQAGGHAHIYSEPGVGITVTALPPATDAAARAAGPVAPWHLPPAAASRSCLSRRAGPAGAYEPDPRPQRLPGLPAAAAAAALRQ